MKDYSPGIFNTMVSIGDSITAGASATSRNLCWVSRLGKLISEFQESELDVINSGIGANVLVSSGSAYEHASKPSGLERYQSDVINHKPDLVTIAFGTNDLRGGTSIDTFIESLNLFIKSIKSETNSVIVVLSTYYIIHFGNASEPWGKASVDLFKECNKEMAICAASHDVIYADVFSAMGEVPWVIGKDKIHPNNLGHALIANKVFEALASRCSGLSRNS